MVPQLISAALAIMCPARGQPFDQTLCDQVPSVSWRLEQSATGTIAGSFDQTTRTITIIQLPNTDPRLSDAQLILPIVAHELLHAKQWSEDPGLQYNASSCLAIETEAMQVQGRAWSWLWYDAPPSTVYGLEEQTDAIALTAPTNAALPGCKALFHA